MTDSPADGIRGPELEVPRLEPIGEWPVSPSGLTCMISSVPGRRWSHAGYRAQISGSGTTVEAVRTGFLLMGKFRRRVTPGSVELHAHQVVLGGESENASRWATGLDLPLVLADLTGSSDSSWTVALESPSVELAADGRKLQVRSAAGDARALFVVSSGHLEPVPADEGVQVSWSASGPARLLAVGARDGADLARVLDLLQRRGAAGLLRQRSMHAEQLHRGGVGISHSAAELGLLYEWAKIAADARMGSWLAGPVAGRNPAELPAMADLASALLGAGLPGHGRAWIREWKDGKSGGRKDGRAECRTGGQDGGASSDGDGGPALLHLVERYRLWAGDDAASGPAPEVPVLPGVDDVPLPALERVAAGLATDEELTAILTWPHRAWRIRPDAPRGEVALAPALPANGTLGAVSRLRIGRTVLDLRLRRRAGMVSFAVRRGAGPKIVASCDLRHLAASEVLLDGEPLGAAAARFEVEGEHELLIHPGA